jgi:hypothetical protein
MKAAARRLRCVPRPAGPLRIAPHSEGTKEGTIPSQTTLLGSAFESKATTGRATRKQLLRSGQTVGRVQAVEDAKELEQIVYVRPLSGDDLDRDSL